MHVTGLKQAGGERVRKVVSRVGPSGKIFRRISYSSSYSCVPPPTLYCVPALFSFQFFFSPFIHSFPINPFSCFKPSKPSYSFPFISLSAERACEQQYPHNNQYPPIATMAADEEIALIIVFVNFCSAIWSYFCITASLDRRNRAYDVIHDSELAWHAFWSSCQVWVPGLFFTHS